MRTLAARGVIYCTARREKSLCTYLLSAWCRHVVVVVGQGWQRYRANKKRDFSGENDFSILARYALVYDSSLDYTHCALFVCRLDYID